MRPSAPRQNERRRAFVFWSFCVLAAPLIGFGTAAAGFGMSIIDPLRDVALIVLASVAEEIVFRGAVQPTLAAWLERHAVSVPPGRRALSVANVATSLLFAALHLWSHPFAIAAAVLPVSLVFGRARELSGRTWPAAALHVYFNLLLYAASALLAGGR